jgi:hypothetical protein
MNVKQYDYSFKSNQRQLAKALILKYGDYLFTIQYLFANQRPNGGKKKQQQKLGPNNKSLSVWGPSWS